MRRRWIVTTVPAALAALVIFGSRPFTQTMSGSPGQPSPHSLTE